MYPHISYCAKHFLAWNLKYVNHHRQPPCFYRVSACTIGWNMITCHWRLPLKLHACTVKWLSEIWKKERGMLLFIRVYMYLKLISDSLSLCSCQQTRSHWKAYIAWWRWSGNHVPRMQRLRYRRRNRGWRLWSSARFVSASQIKVKLEPFTFIRHYT